MTDVPSQQTAPDSTWVRLAPLSGVVYAVLALAGILLIANFDFLPPAEEIKAFYEDNSDRIELGIFLSMPSMFFFFSFVGILRDRLRTAEGGTGQLSAIAFGGGIVAGALMLASYSVTGAAAARGGHDAGIDADVAAGLYDVPAFLFGSASVGFAVLIGAAAMVSFRTRVLPSWLAWVSVPLVVGLLSPVSYIFSGIAFLWIIVVSIVLCLQGRSAAANG